MMKWQPIETAPKDGTKFFGSSAEHEWPEVVYWELYPEDSREDAGDDGYWRYADDLLSDVANVDLDDFTHWMPLPPPPNLS